MEREDTLRTAQSFIMESKSRTNSDKMKKKESDGLESVGLIEGFRVYAVKSL